MYLRDEIVINYTGKHKFMIYTKYIKYY